MGYPNSKTPKPERDCLQTPGWLYNWLNSIYSFDVDLAANKANKKHKKFISHRQNSLKKDWSKYGKIGFLNPPYSKIKPWMEKAIKEQEENGFTTVMVIPTPNGESYFKLAFDHAAYFIFINGRVSFIDKNGKPKNGNNRGTCICVFGKIGGNPRLNDVMRDELIKEFSTTEKKK